MSVRVTWAKGGEARLLSIADDAIVLRSTVPWPPGSRIDGTASHGASVAVALRVKVHSSRRQEQGEFVVQGRPLDLTREVRERLEAWVREDSTQAPDAPASSPQSAPRAPRA
jgi:hypothetical protein